MKKAILTIALIALAVVSCGTNEGSTESAETSDIDFKWHSCSVLYMTDWGVYLKFSDRSACGDFLLKTEQAHALPLVPPHVGMLCEIEYNGTPVTIYGNEKERQYYCP